MIWNDAHLSKTSTTPKFIHYIASGVFFILSYLAINDVITNSNVIDKIISAVLFLIFTFYDLCNLFMILKGSKYVETIRKDGNCFILTNIFQKQISFIISDVLSIDASKFSIIDKFLTGFAKHIPGLDLVLKDGSKYYITSDMENIESLKEHLLGKEK